MPRMDPDSTPFVGLTRREFLSYCGRLAVLMSLSRTAIPDLAAALEELAARPSVVWSCFAECLGCSVSLLQNRSPGPASLILQTISLDYHEALMAGAGTEATRVFDEAVAREGFIYVVEGAIPTRPPEAMMIARKTALSIVRDTAPRAATVIAIGNCAAFGGIQAARPNPTGARGVRAVLGATGKKILALPTCPGNGDALVATLAHILYFGRAPAADSLGRPKFLYGQTVHDNCERRGHFERGKFVERLGTLAEAQGHCLLPVGCKGPYTHAPCPKLLWNDHQNWCVGVGPCTGCAEPRFWDDFAPYYSPRPGARRAGLAGIGADALAGVLAGGAAVGMGAHFIGQAATDRLPWRETEPPEDES